MPPQDSFKILLARCARLLAASYKLRARSQKLSYRREALLNWLNGLIDKVRFQNSDKSSGDE